MKPLQEMLEVRGVPIGNPPAIVFSMFRLKDSRCSCWIFDLYDWDGSSEAIVTEAQEVLLNEALCMNRGGGHYFVQGALMDVVVLRMNPLSALVHSGFAEKGV